MMGAQRLFGVPSTIDRHFAISRKLTDGAITARISSTVELEGAGKILERLRSGGLAAKLSSGTSRMR